MTSTLRLAFLSMKVLLISFGASKWEWSLGPDYKEHPDLGPRVQRCLATFYFLWKLPLIPDWPLLRVLAEFGFGRIIVRTIQVILSACVAIGVPCFPMILSLIGGTTVMLLSYIFPSLFFLQLAQKLGHYVAFHEVVVNYIIIALSIITMCATCYSAIYAFITSSCKFPVVKCST